MLLCFLYLQAFPLCLGLFILLLCLVGPVWHCEYQDGEGKRAECLAVVVFVTYVLYVIVCLLFLLVSLVGFIL